MLHTMTANDCMSKYVHSVHPDDDILSAARLLVEKKISGTPVIDHVGNLVGIVTEKDCMAIAMKAGYYGDAGGKVSAFMSTEVVTVDTETPIMEIAEHFATRNYRRLPVLDRGRVVGIVSRRDVLWLLNERLHNSG